MKAPRGGFQMLRREQLLQEFVHDAYKARRKPREPSACRDCGAVYRNGRWAWDVADARTGKALCPACRRVREHLPAGFITLRGAFFDGHRDEILRRVRHCEAAERRDHPLERIMAMRAEREGLTISTTNVHLARRIGEAVRKAYKGRLRFQYNKADSLLRVVWEH